MSELFKRRVTDLDKGLLDSLLIVKSSKRYTISETLVLPAKKIF